MESRPAATSTMNCKLIATALLLGTAAMSAYGAAPAGTAPGDCDVAAVGDRTRGAYVPNQVIVKLRDSSAARVTTGRRAPAATRVAALDEAFRSIGVEAVDALMPLTGAQTFARRARAFNGAAVDAPSLERAYVLNITADVHQAVETLASVADVEYAEPNYIVYSLAEAADINDPYYSLQYGIADINLNELWGAPVLGKDGPVIAIIDTGVDISHPDLAPNIWTNPGEAEGAEGYDDDNNGYVDDIHGYDFVNQTGAMADYNGHGTHCAGIAAAAGFNGIGIIGANPDARIMPLTVMQSNGTGDIATIIKAIDYAAANGADILSMSLGTYSESMAFREALGRAYQKAVIVAAAGNDGYCLNHAHRERGQMAPMPMFPAAYNFVLGVQASTSAGSLAQFSNYDDDGATFSPYSEEKLYNYELTAPGVGIMSTYPNGQYKNLNGTSMATPLVAGAVSRLLQAKEYTNKEELFGDLINSLTDKGNLDIYRAYTMTAADRRPELQFVSFDMVDADGDGRPDAGETVEFYPVIRNAWGNVSDIKVKIECAETANTFCEFLTTEADFGYSLSSYGKARSANALSLRLNDDVVDGRVCRLRFTATAPNCDPISQEFEINVENGVEIGGVLAEDMTLHAGVHYIVTRTLAIPEGVTVTIEPGAVIKFKDHTGINALGQLVANGKPGNMITFTKADFAKGNVLYFRLSGGYKKGHIEYCVIDGLNFLYKEQWVEGSNIIYRNTLLNNDAKETYGQYPLKGILLDRSNIYNHTCYQPNGGEFLACNLINIDGFAHFEEATLRISHVNNSNVFSNYNENQLYSVSYVSNVASVFRPEQPSYLGSSRQDIVRSHVLDINTPGFGSVGELDLSNMLTRPVAEAHGIVWKVVVNGKDAQDEFEELAPLGVARHKFEVYFNRPMNKAVAPTIAMGVRPPYNQIAIAEEGSWNEAGDIYTAYLTLRGKENIDGLNRIYVAGAEDNEFFEIPVENTRFNVNVQAAGSLSTGFAGEAGLGRVNLTWEDMDMNFEDILGYNMYRINPEGENAPADTIMINERLIDAGTTELTDYDVVPGNTYRYYYKVMTTGLRETDPSRVIAVTPLTATRGDANGSGNVDVADVLATVSYASGYQPRPFIFEAADMNADTEIDIVDVVGIVNVIVGTPAPNMLQSMAEATLTVENGVLWIDSPVEFAGVQFDFTTDPSNRFTVLDALAGFETTGSWRTDDTYRFMAYSLSGKTLPAGRHALLNIGTAMVADARMSTPLGSNINVTYSDTSGIDVVDVDNQRREGARRGVYNVMGVKVGETEADLDRLPAGIYIVNGWKVVK